MWTYVQETGQLFHGVEDGAVAVGYSGRSSCKNRPESQQVPDWGPIPAGMYTMLYPINSERLGPFAIPLVPRPFNEMYGRCGFFIHGDSLTHPGEASDGCIVLPRPIRVEIAVSGDNRLRVVARLTGAIQVNQGVEHGGDTSGDPAGADEPGAKV